VCPVADDHNKTNLTGGRKKFFEIGLDYVGGEVTHVNIHSI
jgi:hypothetical protein